MRGGLELVCGPVSPLPETHQRYRLVEKLGAGGQADVFRGVRVTGGVSSAPMTVKIFRIDPNRSLADELRSWDKGDAVLMDLNNRGVSHICRRSDGFYGPPPHRPGERPVTGDAVPYQVYEYLHGVNLREYVAQRNTWQGSRINALTALSTLAGVLRDLHHPQSFGATPVLHMDIKPANVMVLGDGAIRLIDFTGARYWRTEEITQVSYTREAGGPEAFDGARAVTPAYDVHGFGAVAYYLVTGTFPRVESAAAVPAPPPWSVLRHHPMLERSPRLRDHLQAAVADRPGDRPDTRELDGWVESLGQLVRSHGVPDIGVDWHDPGAPPAAVPPVSGPPVSVPPVSGPPVPGLPARSPMQPHHDPTRTRVHQQQPDGPVNLEREQPIRGRAVVPPPRPRREDTGVVIDPVHGEPPPLPWHAPVHEDPRTLKLGWEYSGIGAAFSFVCWGIWAASNSGDNLTGPLVMFLVILAVAAGLFALSRLIGRLVLVQRLGRTRRTARIAHAVTGGFLLVVGLGFLQQTQWVISAISWIRGQ
jgi:serine/threonine protein kinase